MAVNLTTIRGDYLERVRQGDREQALALVTGPVERGELDLASFYDQVLGPVASRVGDLWHAGAMTVAEEHYATGINREARLLARNFFEPAPRNGRRVLLACAPEEQHDLGLHMVSDVLELAGYEASMLGMRTPAPDLASFAGQIAADAAVVSCSTPLTVTGLIHAVQLCHARGIRVVVGGSAVRDYPAVARAAAADAICTVTGEIVATVDALLSS